MAGGIKVRKGRRTDSAGFLGLVEALARFEHLEPPSEPGKRRLLEDVFRKRRLHLFIATDGVDLLGYALYFYSYSSFLARPTLYLEDIFVLAKSRNSGVGLALFRRCAQEAVRQKCGRMEWAVLPWNKGAIGFYEKLGARRLDDWHFYRLDDDGIRKASKA